MLGGDWVIPHLNGLDYIEKPPLQYWATAATYRLLGVSEFSARLYTALTALAATSGFVNHDLQGVKDFSAIPGDQRRALRLNIYLVSETLARMIKAKTLPPQLDAKAAADYQKMLKGVTNFIPTWVKVAVADGAPMKTAIAPSPNPR